MNRVVFLQVSVLAILVLSLVYLGWLGYGALPYILPAPAPETEFQGERALALAQAQCDIGPRPSGTPAGRQTGDWIIERLEELGWEVELHEFTHNGVAVRNIIGKGGQGVPLMVGAHYDTRPIAENDPDPAAALLPIVGANDGASGVAVLLELAAVIDREQIENEVWLAFFDAEDNGRIPGWNWAEGSRRLAADLTTLPAAMILVDMVGDADQRFPYEGNSNPALREQLWQLAAELGYGDVFVPELGPPITDDHVGFIERGVPSVDIIDFTYPYWHTSADTCDKLSATSLERVGRVVETWLESAPLSQPPS